MICGVVQLTKLLQESSRSCTSNLRTGFLLDTLAMRRQQTSENLDQFMRKLKSLARDGKFKLVTAEKSQDGTIKLFVTGDTPASIRKLFAQPTNSLWASTISRNSSQSYQTEAVYTAFRSISRESGPATHSSNNAMENIGTPIDAILRPSNCFFGGFGSQTRTLCPARDAVCKPEGLSIP